MYVLVQMAIDVALPAWNQNRGGERVCNRNDLLYPKDFENSMTGRNILRAEEALSIAGSWNRSWCNSWWCDRS
jgi:hypothetical protein